MKQGGDAAASAGEGAWGSWKEKAASGRRAEAREGLRRARRAWALRAGCGGAPLLADGGAELECADYLELPEGRAAYDRLLGRLNAGLAVA